ncbi:MAG: hypothetical protein IKM43_00400 [Clostridia bacterium]|nr:hypothetical protein [Clostridia bacterium]
MSVESKRKLSVIVYYTLVILAIVSAIFFAYTLIIQNMVMWAKVVYFIWVGLVIGAVIYDVICTTTKESKYMSGWIVYILSLLSVVVAVVLYFMNTTRTGLIANFFNMVLSTSLISFIVSGFLIATWCVGESMVEHRTAEREIEGR